MEETGTRAASTEAPRKSRLTSAGRTVAAFLGALCALNLVLEAIGRFNANAWWIDLRSMPAALAVAIQIAAGAALLLAAAGVRTGAVRAVLVITLVIAVANAVAFYVARAGGEVRGSLFPFSLLIAAALGLVMHATRGPARRLHARSAGLTALACVIGFPLAQMFLFGKTDYRRPADAIVVFGARAYADGRPSDALADRVRTAADLYREGYAPRLVFSGGPGDGAIHETEAMRDYAIGLGVPADAITLDPAGLNTAATVRNTVPMLHDAARVLVVSHFYHLPRVKLTYQRAGREVFTVPASERYVLTSMPLLVAREVAALWVYYLRGM